VAGSEYRNVRVGAFMGYRILAEHAGLVVAALGDRRVQVDDPRWRGYLANVSPSDWHAEFRQEMPELLEGAAFLERYGGTTDAVARVDPAQTYAVRPATAHPIHEHRRVELFRGILKTRPPVRDGLRRLGELMYESHASYGACGLGSAGTDRLVDLVRQAGSDAGLFGARITGGGCGGTVAVLGRHDAGGAVQDIATAYARETAREATVFSGSSAGADQFGLLRLHSGRRA
jgi:L-arabinokinase